MRIIYSGGWNKNSPESIKASFMYAYQPFIKQAVRKGKKIAIVTLAKPDGSYDKIINELYKDIVDVIDSKSKNIAWDSYDGIFILGGVASDLKSGLVRAGFDLVKLKKNAVLLGDSAGAYVLSTYFYQSPPGELRGIDMEYMEGFNPGANLITVAHKDNPVYCNSTLLKAVTAFAKELGLTLLILKENEQRTVVKGKKVSVDASKLFLS